MTDNANNVTTENDAPTFEDRVNALIEKLETRVKDDRAIISELKALRKEHTKIVKKAGGRKKKTKDPNAPKRAASGFAKPTVISAELAEFLGVSEGEMIARPDVTKGITAYVRKFDLQKPENKRNIDLTKPGGEELRKMLRVPKGEELTFFNLQTYLKVHFPASKAKKAKEVATEVATEIVAQVEAEQTTAEPKRRRRKVAAAAN